MVLGHLPPNNRRRVASPQDTAEDTRKLDCWTSRAPGGPVCHPNHGSSGRDVGHSTEVKTRVHTARNFLGYLPCLVGLGQIGRTG